MVEHPNEPETNNPHPHSQHEPGPGDDFPADFFDDATDTPSAGSESTPPATPGPDADVTPAEPDVEAPTSEPIEPVAPTPPPAAPPVEPAPGAPVFPIVVGLLLLGLLAGAIVYNMKASRGGDAATTTAATAPAEPPKPDAVALLSSDVKEIETDLAELTTQVKGLETKVGVMPKTEAPPDLKPLQDRVDALAKTSESVEALPKKVDALDERVGAVDKSLAELKEQVASLRDEVKKAGEQAAVAPVPASTAADVAPTASLDDAVKLFKAGKFKEADDQFLKMTESNPNDARAWYFAALSNGFATGKWDGKTAELVQKGIEREKAGTPAPAEIDAAFRDLTAATGKDWLAAYRKQAKR